MAALHGKNQFSWRDEQKASTFHHHTLPEDFNLHPLVLTLQGCSTPTAPSCGQMVAGKQPRDKGQVPVSPLCLPRCTSRSWMLCVITIYRGYQNPTSSISLPSTQPWGKQGRWKGIYSSGAVQGVVLRGKAGSSHGLKNTLS